MKLYLASQFYVCGRSIGEKIEAVAKQKTVFITTPIKYRVFKDSELEWHYKNRQTLKDSGFIYQDYDITGKSESDLSKDLTEYQVMYVEGGSPFYLMQEAQKNHFSEYLTDRVKNGMIYVSESAGSVVAGIDISANSRPGKSASDYDLRDTQGFGLVNYSILPHWGQESKRPDTLTYKVPQTYREDYPTVLLSNNQYIEVTGNMCKIVDITK